MTAKLTDVVADLARATAIDLSPHWRDAAGEEGDDRAALSRITGVGARKLDAYGDSFLSVIRDHR